MRIPIIKVFDKSAEDEYLVGSDSHDTLLINENGHITYHNLQNDEGTEKGSCYEFIGNDDYFGKEIEFLDVEEYLKLIKYDASAEGKAKPKRVVTELVIGRFRPCCPNCCKAFAEELKGKINYCYNCGQKLDWNIDYTFERKYKQIFNMCSDKNHVEYDTEE